MRQNFVSIYTSITNSKSIYANTNVHLSEKEHDGDIHINSVRQSIWYFCFNT